MKYQVIRNVKYDFAGQSYSDAYPNLHKYPATMLPQIGIELLKELDVRTGRLLDPYCGSGSTFTAALRTGLKQMDGYDINPLAVLIANAKFCKIEPNELHFEKNRFRIELFDFIKVESNVNSIPYPSYHNLLFWFSEDVVKHLLVLRKFVNEIPNELIKRFFWVALSETIRECSLTRSSEFKLFRMKPEEVMRFNPDVISFFFKRLTRNLDYYEYCYYPLIGNAEVNINMKSFSPDNQKYDIVLTSPPYGDSRTTVAYGQFSLFANEWMEFDRPRALDGQMMGGKVAKEIYPNSLITEYLHKIEQESPKRALEAASFYQDLEKSISNVASAITNGGLSIYIVGNRTVKGVQLPTDQFIAEKFEENGFRHKFTYERLLGNKSIPLRNSPTNEVGKTANTMNKEYIVVCQKV